MVLSTLAVLLLVAPSSPVPMGAATPSRGHVVDLGRLGSLRIGGDVRWGWPGLAGRGFSLSPEPRMIHRLRAAWIRHDAERLRLEWITVGPSPDPRLRWGMGQPGPVEGLPSALGRVAVPIPRTNLDVSMQRRVDLPMPRASGAIAPTTAALGGRF